MTKSGGNLVAEVKLVVRLVLFHGRLPPFPNDTDKDEVGEEEVDCVVDEVGGGGLQLLLLLLGKVLPSSSSWNLMAGDKYLAKRPPVIMICSVFPT